MNNKEILQELLKKALGERLTKLEEKVSELDAKITQIINTHNEKILFATAVGNIIVTSQISYSKKFREFFHFNKKIL